MKIVAIRPSANWYAAVVIVLECGHRHVRPRLPPGVVAVGDDFACCFCAEAEPETKEAHDH